MRFLVIGCGSIGLRHIGNLLALGHEVAAYNRGEEHRAIAAQRYGVRVFSDVNEALDIWPAGAAVIATPQTLHLENALAAAERGLHLFVEKPLADRIEGLDTLEAEANVRSLVTQVGCNMRFHFGPARVKEFIDGRRIGRPLWAQVWGGMHLPDWHPDEDYREMYSAKLAMGGGAVLDFIHEIDLVRWMFGDPCRIAAMVGRSGWLEIETEDMADALLGYRDGLQVNLHLDYLQRPYQRGIRVVGDKGWIQWDLARGCVEWYEHETRQGGTLPPPENWEHNDMYVAQMRHFISRIERRDRSDNGLAEGRKALELALKIKVSSARNSFMREEVC